MRQGRSRVEWSRKAGHHFPSSQQWMGNAHHTSSEEEQKNPFMWRLQGDGQPRVGGRFIPSSHGGRPTRKDEQRISKRYTTITTHKGLYSYNRLLFGIASPAAIFQRQMDQIFKDLPQVLWYQDDIFGDWRRHKGTPVESSWSPLIICRTMTWQHNVKKCEFLKPSLTYLGHIIDKKGIHPVHDKVAAIKSAKPPTDVAQLRGLLGSSQLLTKVSSKFVRNTVSTASTADERRYVGLDHAMPKGIRQGERNDHSWWCPNALRPRDAPRPWLRCISLQPRSSSLPQAPGQDWAFCRLRFTDTNQERKKLRTNWKRGSIHFFLWRNTIPFTPLYGRPFTLRTDHQPLMTILGPKRGIPLIAAMRMQWWATKLAAYSYAIQYRSSQEHCNADGLSRLPQSIAQDEDFNHADVYQLEQLEPLPVTAPEIEQHIQSDPVLHRVHDSIQLGFMRADVGEEIKPFVACSLELPLCGWCIMRGHRVVIHSALRRRVLDELHDSHLGIVKMKEIARSYVWWPGIDKDIEGMAKSCEPCNAFCNSPPAQHHPWSYPQAPWEENTPRFRWSYRQPIFLNCCRCYLKVVGGNPYAQNNLYSDHRSSTWFVLTFWTPCPHSQWQRSPTFIWWICPIHKTQWYHTHHNGTISPKQQWTDGMICPNFQVGLQSG